MELEARMMEDIDDRDVPVEEIEEEEVCVEVPDETAKPSGRSFFLGLASGTVVGGLLALLLAPLQGEQRSRKRWQSREGIEQEGAFRARVAGERAKSVAGGFIPAIRGAWNAVRERLRDAAEETKRGYEEGQTEARNRYEAMTRRRGRR
jgi:gas vesicle protein